MKLYLISQNENSGYDTYDSAVVAAPDEETARNISPRSYSDDVLMNWEKAWRWGSSSWATAPENVNVEYLGEAKDGTKLGVICASFNAG